MIEQFDGPLVHYVYDKLGYVETQIDFGVRDNRGRLIGAKIFRYQEKRTQVSDMKPGVYYPIAMPMFIGTFYFFRPHATRDGATYGAGQDAQIFFTEAAREEAIAKYLESAQKRAMAKAGK